jgi:hypothetical protein
LVKPANSAFESGPPSAAAQRERSVAHWQYRQYW